MHWRFSLALSMLMALLVSMPLAADEGPTLDETLALLKRKYDQHFLSLQGMCKSDRTGDTAGFIIDVTMEPNPSGCVIHLTHQEFISLENSPSIDDKEPLTLDLSKLKHEDLSRLYYNGHFFQTSPYRGDSIFKFCERFDDSYVYWTIGKRDIESSKSDATPAGLKVKGQLLFSMLSVASDDVFVVQRAWHRAIELCSGK